MKCAWCDKPATGECTYDYRPPVRLCDEHGPEHLAKVHSVAEDQAVQVWERDYRWRGTYRT